MYRNRIFNAGSAREFKFTIDKLREDGGLFVSLNGCFDLPHRGHIELLHYARSLCVCNSMSNGFVIAGLNSDTSVKSIKGDKRPIINEVGRAKFLLSTRLVDYVYVFDDITPNNFLKIVKPAIHVNDSSFGEYCVERKDLDEMGTMLSLFPKIKDTLSTTEIIEIILERC